LLLNLSTLTGKNAMCRSLSSAPPPPPPPPPSPPPPPPLLLLPPRLPAAAARLAAAARPNARVSHLSQQLTPVVETRLFALRGHTRTHA
jgi:hypothetical protein